jgi:hypothetical protein
LPKTEQAARGSLFLIGSALPPSRGSHVRKMFGIEEFCGKLNGHRPLPKMLHSNISARGSGSFAGFDPLPGLRRRHGGFKADS